MIIDEKIKDWARDTAKKAFKKRQICSIEGCSDLGERHHVNYLEPKNIVWLCPKHHRLEHGKTIPKFCDVKDCGKIHFSRGKCKHHYYQFFWKDKLYKQRQEKKKRKMGLP